MCGICGAVDGRGASPGLVRQMADTLVHRGPDDQGFYASSHCVLGHRRLKIIDLSPLGRQPMCNEDESVWISFNGEIYNYHELRAELAGRGHRFRSQTDTEVILHLYEDEGEGCLARLNGMFAFALWDERRRRLLLARDRFGKKPIYYYCDGQRLLFGSELKALLADPSVPRELDSAALPAYLALGYIPCPATIFRGVYKLPPASLLTVDVNGTELKVSGPTRYWTIRYDPDPRISEAECVERIWALVQDAVRVRMYSDVPLGAFLSGGLDSSTVVAAMAGLSERPVETFSVGFDEPSFDELNYARLVAERFHTHHHVLRCEPDAVQVLPTLIHHYDEPFADSSAIPTYYVSKLAREFVTVVLSGDGGDEIFAGYLRYDDGALRSRVTEHVPAALVQGIFRFLTDLYPFGRRGWGILHRNSLSPLDAYLADLCVYQPIEQHTLLAEESRAGANGRVQHLFHDLAHDAGSPDFLSQMQYVDQMLYLPDDILVKVDRASMAVSLETRCPLLDYRLAELMARVPASLRYRRRTKKYLLKRALSGRLPEQILHRGKMGFAVPLKHWFRKGWGEFVRDALLSQRARERGIFRPQQVEKLLSIHSQGRRDFSNKIWALIFFEMWCETWLDQPRAAPVGGGG